MGPLLEMHPYPPADDGLPVAVADTRERLITAAVSCDVDTVLELTGEPQSTAEEPAYRDEFWWSATISPAHFVENDRVYGALRELVWALAWTRYGVESLEQEDGSIGITYRWPEDYGWLGTGKTFGDIVPFDDLSRMDALNRMEVGDLVDAVGDFGAHALFRTGIDDDGQWLFALSGD